MAYSFDPELARPLDMVRVLIGDTDENKPLLTDEAITRFLTIESNNQVLAAASCCTAIAARFARLVSTAMGDFRAEMQHRFRHYRELAKDLREGAIGAGSITGLAEVYAGGISLDDKAAYRQDGDRFSGVFSVDMHGRWDTRRRTSEWMADA